MSAESMVGERLQGRYRLDALLGEGAAGAAYLAYDALRERSIVLKKIPMLRLRELPTLHAEFEILRRLSHPGISRVLDFGYYRVAEESGHFYTAELVKGEAFHGWVQRHPEGLREVLMQLLDALGFLHDAGIRHGDLKSENVMVREDGRPVLIDFGCARPLSETHPSEISGTPHYMAPELLRGGPVDHRADFFALGRMLGELSPALRDRLDDVSIDAFCADDVGARPADARGLQEWIGDPVGRMKSPYGSPPHLLGRDAILERSRRGIVDFIAGVAGPRVWVVEGPRGSGRSRILREIKCLAQVDVLSIAGDVKTGISGVLRVAAKLDAHPLSSALVPEYRRATSGQQPRVLLIDDADRLAPEEAEVLAALLRSFESEESTLLVLASLPDSLAAEHDVMRLLLEPLPREEVGQWMEPLLPSSMLDEVMRVTGAWPAMLQRLWVEVRAGRVREDQLGRYVDLQNDRSVNLSGLDEACLRALSAICLGDRGERIPFDLMSAERLVDAGWLERDGDDWRLLRCEEVTPLLRAIDPEIIRSVHASYARFLEGRSGIHVARRVGHLVRAGACDEAQQILCSHRRAWYQHPSTWADSASRLVDAVASLDSSTALFVGELFELAGRFERAVDVLKGAQSPTLPDEALGRLNEALARVALRQGDLDTAEAQLDKVGELALPRRADLLSRIRIKQGKYAEAHALAINALDGCEDCEVRADLHDDAGIAASYLGHIDDAQKQLAEAEALHEANANLPARLRSLSYRAFTAYRAGKLQDAQTLYARVLMLAERHALGHHIADAALNLGSCLHQSGQWGHAFDAYDRGLRMSTALGKAGATVTLRFNLAKLYLDIGLLKRSEVAAERTLHEADGLGMRFFAAAARSIGGLSKARAGAFDEGRALLLLAKEGFEQEGADREIAEVCLELADLAAEQGRAQDVESWLTRVGEGEALDINAEKFRLLGRLAVLRDEQRIALTHFRRALDYAEDAGSVSLRARINAEIAKIARPMGLGALADAHGQRALMCWEEVASTLSEAHQVPFWKAYGRDVLREQPVHQPATNAREFQRLLAINRKLASSLDVNEVLETTIDASMELTGAERGFVILIEENHGQEVIRVAVARNLETDGTSAHWSFSRNIAEQVLRSGESVFTMDAVRDERFRAHRSVHAMQLKSVLCVPVRNHRGVLGALYLDNRMWRGQFTQQDQFLLMAFADQAAIALTNARLVTALEERSRELEAERNHVRDLAENRGVEINRLTAEVQAKQEVLETRYDYSRIVAQSAVMADVFRVLDRVTDTDVPVLIQGESGTGKELVARAIHFNGPRRAASFVPVNCGALPANLLESEFFGHVRGAFTGANRDKVGLFQQANGGTLFLDEVGEMAPDLQVKLLRVLQEGEVRPLGSTKAVSVDVRVISATNRRLREAISRGLVREDFYYRIGVVEVNLPPLRERLEDIPGIAEHILRELAAQMKRPDLRLEPLALRHLMVASWPGNVRELRNVLTKALVLADGDTIGPDAIRLEGQSMTLPSKEAPAGRSAYRREEAARIEMALRDCDWNVSRVARELGMARATLYRKMKRYGISE